MAEPKESSRAHELRSCEPYYSDDPDPRYDVPPPHLNKNAITILSLLSDKQALLPPPEERPSRMEVVGAIRVEDLKPVANIGVAMMFAGRALTSWRSPWTWGGMCLGAVSGFGIAALRTYMRMMGVSPELGP